MISWRLWHAREDVPAEAGSRSMTVWNWQMCGEKCSIGWISRIH